MVLDWWAVAGGAWRPRPTTARAEGLACRRGAAASLCTVASCSSIGGGGARETTVLQRRGGRRLKSLHSRHPSAEVRISSAALRTSAWTGPKSQPAVQGACRPALRSSPAAAARPAFTLAAAQLRGVRYRAAASGGGGMRAIQWGGCVSVGGGAAASGHAGRPSGRPAAFRRRAPAGAGCGRRAVRAAEGACCAALRSAVLPTSCGALGGARAGTPGPPSSAGT